MTRNRESFGRFGADRGQRGVFEICKGHSCARGCAHACNTGELSVGSVDGNSQPAAEHLGCRDKPQTMSRVTPFVVCKN